MARIFFFYADCLGADLRAVARRAKEKRPSNVDRFTPFSQSS